MTIKTEDEQKFLSSRHDKMAKSGVQDYWIGLSNVDDHSEVRWVDGDYLDYSQFGNDQELNTTQG